MQGTAHQQIKSLALAAPVSVNAAATVVSANSIDVTGFREVLAVLLVGAFTGGVTSVTIEIEDSANGTSFAAVAGASSTTTVGTVAGTHFVRRARTAKLRQYARIKITVNGGTSAIVGGALLGIEAQVQPVTQVGTLAFNLD